MQRRSSYKQTLIDKLGPDAGNYFAAIRLRIVAAVVSFIVAGSVGLKVLHLDGASLAAFTLMFGATLTAAAWKFGAKVSDATGAGVSHVYMGGSSTPYEDQFSEEQARVMERDFEGALDLFEQKIAANPADFRVRVAAADLCSGHAKKPERAAELYREVQRMPEIPKGQDAYVSNKLADLYLGPLKQPRKALVEFRKLIEKYPNTNISKNARLALDNLKPDLVKGPDST